VVHRTARVGLRLTAGQAARCRALLRSAGDVWACVIEVNRWRWQRRDRPLVSYQELCRELAVSGPGTFAELDSVGARSVLRRYSDAWFAAAAKRKAGDWRAGFPRRRRFMMAVRWYHGTFAFDEARGRVRIPIARGCPPLWVRLARPVPYPPEQVRSITLLYDGGRLYVDVTAEVPLAAYPPGTGPDPNRAAGVDLGVIHPYAVAGPHGWGLLVSGRAMRAEHRMHLADTKARQRAVAARAPSPGQRGSRRWRKYRARARIVEGRHQRRVRQAMHEAAKTVVGEAVARRVGTLVVGDPRTVLDRTAGRRHNLRLRQWRVGQAIAILTDKATLAGIAITLVDERGTSSTCPACTQRIPKPSGRTITCPYCGYTGHRDLTAAAIIATRGPRASGTLCTGTVMVPTQTTHRRAGRHLPGAGPSRRDPRRHTRAGTRSPWPAVARPAHPGESLAQQRGSTVDAGPGITRPTSIDTALFI
jgi:putative transposase